MNFSSPLVQTNLAADAPAAAHTCVKLMRRLKQGSLRVQWPDGSWQHFGEDAQGSHLQAHLVFKNWNLCAAALKSGDIGVAETYIAGDWNTPDLAALLRVFIVNRRELEEVIYGTWLGRLIYRLKHWLNRNTKSNSQKNIHAHYDLGNAFYDLWLDASMTYSSAWFEGNLSGDLQKAQMAKVRRAMRMLATEPNDRVLEIGCGWGGLAEIAALEFQSQLTGVTLSTEQLSYAQERMSQAGVGSQVQLRLQDYRDIQDEAFDAICSIEMIEAVGHQFWPEYFQTIARLLKPGKRAVIQAITIDDALFERYIQSTDFIQQYIFPGGCLPSPSEFRKAAQNAGLQVIDQFAFGADYAETCRRWRKDFLMQRAAILPLGFDEAFMRTWEFYLAYCEAAFDEKNTNVMQFTLLKN